MWTRWIVTFFTLSHVAVSSLTSLGQVVNVNSISYYVPAVPVAHIRASSIRGIHGAGALVPVTILDTSSAAISSTIETYAQLDDVWNDGFLEGRSCDLLRTFESWHLFFLPADLKLL